LCRQRWLRQQRNDKSDPSHQPEQPSLF
jgi:hypothetical protein